MHYLWCTLFLGLVGGIAAFSTVVASGAYLQALAVWVLTALWLVPWIVHAERTRRLRKYPQKRVDPCCAPDVAWVAAGLGCSIVTCFLVFWVFALLASQQSADFPFQLAVSPCGRSPCSSSSSLNPWPYNARGYFPSPYGHDDVLATVLSLCPNPACRWADVNDSLIKGYPPGDDGLPDRTQPPVPGGLATQNPLDYPDLAVGLAAGLTIAATVADISNCPGVYNNLNPAGKLGKGGAICAQCTSYFQRYRGFADGWTAQSCASAQYRPGDEYWCWLCPDISVAPYLGSIAFAYLGLFFCLVLALLLALANVC